MRILHTSDWHLGRSFKRVPLLEEQCRFVDQDYMRKMFEVYYFDDSPPSMQM